MKKKTKVKRTSKKIKNKINKYIKIFREYEKLIKIIMFKIMMLKIIMKNLQKWNLN